MSTFDLFINFIEALGYIGFVYLIFHKKKSLFLLCIFVLIKAIITTIHNYYLLPELSLVISSQLVIFLYCYFLNKDNIIQNIFITLLVFNINNFSTTIGMLVTNIFYAFPFYQGDAYIFIVVFSKIIFYLYAYLAYCILNKLNISFHKSNKIISILVILFVLQFLYSSCIELIFYNNIFDIYVILILLFIDILVLVLCFTFYESQNEQAHILKLQEINLKSENQMKINRINEESTKHLALWKHDITYVFTYLENYIKAQKYNEALKTISIYTNILNNYNLFINTNNDTLNSVLIEYTETLTQNDIHIYIHTDQSKVLLSVDDYKQLLYMFLDHAILNCLSPYQKEIRILYFTKSPYFTLSLEYSCLHSSLDVLQDQVQSILNKYNGLMKISNQNNRDVLTMIIPIMENYE